MGLKGFKRVKGVIVLEEFDVFPRLKLISKTYENMKKVTKREER